jgi:hypothetical protein
MIPPCSQHPSPAGWRCLGCGRALCPECVAEDAVGAATYLSCTHCDGRAEVLMVPGSTQTVSEILREIFQVPPSWATVLLGPVVVILLWRAKYLEGWSAAALWLLVVAPLFWGMFFMVLRATARSYDLVAAADPLDPVAHVVVPVARAVALTAAGALVVLALRSFTGADAATSNPGLWALTWIAGAYLPLVTARLGAGEPLLQALSPPRWLEAVKALGTDYRAVAGLSVLTASLAFFLSGSAEQGIQGPWMALPHALSVYLLLVVARFAGALLAVRGPELGFELRPDQLRAALPDARPRGARAARPPPPPPKVIQPLTLDMSAPTGPLEVEYGLLSSGGAGLESMSGAELVTRAQAAFARGEMELGVRALGAATSDPDPATASRALVILARVRAERLQDPAGAAQLYRQVVARYPDTPAAAFARGRLGGEDPG